MNTGHTELIGLESQRQYPPHGTRYATSGRIGNFWWTVPVIVGTSGALALAPPLLVDLIGLEEGPLAATPPGMKGKAKLVVAFILIGAYLLCSILPGLIAGWIAGASGVLAHTRSKLAIVVGAADAAVASAIVGLVGFAALADRQAALAANIAPAQGHFRRMGRVLDDPSVLFDLLGPWTYGSAIAATAAIALGTRLALKYHGHGFLYDEVAESWYGRRVTIGPDFGLVDGGVTPDALRAMPPSRAAESEPWIEVRLHPTANPDPARELVSAVRVFIRVDDKGKESRVERDEMPPTYVDARIVKAIVKAGPGG